MLLIRHQVYTRPSHAQGRNPGVPAVHEPAFNPQTVGFAGKDAAPDFTAAQS
jgi:hypothetical protein